jgi:hypothetical protein
MKNTVVGFLLLAAVAWQGAAGIPSNATLCALEHLPLEDFVATSTPKGFGAVGFRLALKPSCVCQGRTGRCGCS